MKKLKFLSIIFTLLLFTLSIPFTKINPNLLASADKNNQKVEEVIIDSYYTQDSTLHIPNNANILTEITAKEIANKIVYDKEFFIDGTITNGLHKEKLSNYYDFSKTSKFEIAKWAYAANLISEEEKIECYCKLIENKNFINKSCLTEITWEISQYNNSILENSNIDGSQNTNDNLILPQFTDMPNETTSSNENFTVVYNSLEISASTATSVLDYLNELKSTFEFLEFRTPRLQTFQTKYFVYLDSEADPDTEMNAYGYAYPTNLLINNYASYIRIFRFETLTDFYKEILAHEYFHAIQFAYNGNYNWFSEACANWSTFVACTTHSSLTPWINQYLTADKNTPMETLAGYSAVLFPLTIQYKYGGINAIRLIYDEYAKHNLNVSLSQFRTIISTGINESSEKYNHISGNFEDVYRDMTLYAISPSTWYSIIGNTSNWNNITPNRETTLLFSDINIVESFQGLSSRYYLLQPNNILCNCTTTIDITCSNSNGRIQIYKKYKNGNYELSTPPSTSDNTYIFNINNISNIEKFYIIVSNIENQGSMNAIINISMNHNFTSYSQSTINTHICTCSCGSYSEAHTWEESTTGYTCWICGLTSTIIPGELTSIPEELLEKLARVEVNGNYYVDIGNNTLLCVIDGEYYFVKNIPDDEQVQNILNNCIDSTAQIYQTE